jgi:hypothetical protein
MKTPRIVTETHIDYVQIGAMLREARDAKLWDIEHVSATLRFRRQWIEALEAGDLSIFPTLVYGRGYLVKYAKMLDMESCIQSPPVREVLLEAGQSAYALGDAAIASVLAYDGGVDRRLQAVAAQGNVKLLYVGVLIGLIGLNAWLVTQYAKQIME